MESFIKLVKEFIEWKKSLHKEIRDGEMMYDVPKHYMWLTEDRLFGYWFDTGRFLDENK